MRIMGNVGGIGDCEGIRDGINEDGIVIVGLNEGDCDDIDVGDLDGGDDINVGALVSGSESVDGVFDGGAVETSVDEVCVDPDGFNVGKSVDGIVNGESDGKDVGDCVCDCELGSVGINEGDMVGFEVVDGDVVGR